jgi:hypothetical protein
VSPNKIVSSARAGTEIRHLAIREPAAAALIVNDASQVTLNNQAQIQGGSAIGLAYNVGTGPNRVGLNVLSGSPATRQAPTGVTYDLSVSDVFQVSLPIEIRHIADVVVSGIGAGTSLIMTPMSLTFVDGNATFDATNPLSGSGVLFVNGNLTVATGPAQHYFNGIVYVTGNIVIQAAAAFSGMVITPGSVTLGPGGAAQILRDNGLVTQAIQQVGQYREDKTMSYTFTGDQLTR